MHLEFPAAVHDVVVDALAVLTVDFTARPPASFEHVLRIGGERREDRDALRGGGRLPRTM